MLSCDFYIFCLLKSTIYTSLVVSKLCHIYWNSNQPYKTTKYQKWMTRFPMDAKKRDEIIARLGGHCTKSNVYYEYLRERYNHYDKYLRTIDHAKVTAALMVKLFGE